MIGKPRIKKILLVASPIIFSVGLLGFFVYTKNSVPPAEVSVQDKAGILQAVRKLMLVPSEEPIIATINQAGSLVKEQPFYAGAENGDKLIIFPQLQKAIIYSPKRNIIVNSGPFVLNSGSKAVSTNPPK